jgi:hypothetical protein
MLVQDIVTYERRHDVQNGSDEQNLIAWCASHTGAGLLSKSAMNIACPENDQDDDRGAQ